MLMNQTYRTEDGVTRCSRMVNLAVENVKGDASKGYHNIQSTCGMPITTRISDNVKGCPRCDKEPAVGWVNPRITSAASIPLTAAELKQCGVTEDTSLKPALVRMVVKEKKVREKKAMEAKVSKVRKDIVTIEVDLSTLEAGSDVAALLVKKASEALDKLPVTNFAESKRLIKLQEKLEQLLAV